MLETEKQRTLMGGTVEDYQAGQRMFAMLAELMTKPIIGFTGWETAITHEQVERIKIERLKQLTESNGTITEATDYEALTYLMTASLANPLGMEAFNIYAYLFRKFYPEQADEILEKYQGLKLEEWTEKRELTRLKQWLFKTRK